MPASTDLGSRSVTCRPVFGVVADVSTITPVELGGQCRQPAASYIGARVIVHAVEPMLAMRASLGMSSPVVDGDCVVDKRLVTVRTLIRCEGHGNRARADVGADHRTQLVDRHLG